jgi:POLQ-like helicase
MMSDMSFAAKEVLPHRQYKQSVSLAAAAWFKAKGLAVSHMYPYCLHSRDKWADNIILPEVAEFVEDECKARNACSEAFPLHKFVHHGLSSQALLFNLVGPLIVREDLGPLQAAFTEVGVPWPSGRLKASLETQDRNVFKEERGQPTSIDLVLEGEAAPSLFIEAKFVEQSFGGCSVFETAIAVVQTLLEPFRCATSIELAVQLGKASTIRLSPLGHHR